MSGHQSGHVNGYAPPPSALCRPAVIALSEQGRYRPERPRVRGAHGCCRFQALSAAPCYWAGGEAARGEVRVYCSAGAQQLGGGKRDVPRGAAYTSGTAAVTGRTTRHQEANAESQQERVSCMAFGEQGHSC